MNFSDALILLKNGFVIKRQTFDYSIKHIPADKEIWVVGGQLNGMPWYTGSHDILAEDWELTI